MRRGVGHQACDEVEGARSRTAGYCRPSSCSSRQWSRFRSSAHLENLGLLLSSSPPSSFVDKTRHSPVVQHSQHSVFCLLQQPPVLFAPSPPRCRAPSPHPPARPRHLNSLVPFLPTSVTSSSVTQAGRSTTALAPTSTFTSAKVQQNRASSRLTSSSSSSRATTRNSRGTTPSSKYVRSGTALKPVLTRHVLHCSGSSRFGEHRSTRRPSTSS